MWILEWKTWLLTKVSSFLKSLNLLCLFYITIVYLHFLYMTGTSTLHLNTWRIQSEAYWANGKQSARFAQQKYDTIKSYYWNKYRISLMIRDSSSNLSMTFKSATTTPLWGLCWIYHGRFNHSIIINRMVWQTSIFLTVIVHLIQHHWKRESNVNPLHW